MNLSIVGLAAAASLLTSPESAIDHLFAAFNRHDVTALQKLYSSTAKLTSSDFCRPRTGADVTRTYAAMFQEFPDIRDDIMSVVVSGNQAAVRFTSSSNLPQHKFRFELMTYFKFSEGLIVEDDTVFDTQGRACES